VNVERAVSHLLHEVERTINPQKATMSEALIICEELRDTLSVMIDVMSKERDEP
jgi:hypothetical protein